MADCEAISPKGQRCRVEGTAHDPHSAGYGADFEVWPNPDYVPAYTRPKLSDADLYRLAKEARLDKPSRARRTDPATSHAAIPDNLTVGQQAVLDVLARGPNCDEVLADLLDGVIAPSGVRTRRSELVTFGLVVDTGTTVTTRSGKQSVVWALAP